MPILLAVDDDPTILRLFAALFPPPDVTLLTAGTATDGLRLVRESRPDAVILDIRLPDLSGLDAFLRIRELDARLPVLFLTGHGTMATAIEAMKLGALEYLLKDDLLEPAQTARLRELVRRAFEISRLARTPALVPDEAEPAAGPADLLVGRCGAMQEVYKAIGRVAPQDVTVLILGESGTGKELVARAIYQHSRRGQYPFLAINCAAIPEALLESELFGHEKGAFSGAERRRIGKFEQCTGGTIFLDEVGDMSPLTQTKILRVLQEQQFERVGGNETIRGDVRILAATNRDLETMVAEGSFRADLYYRLSVFTIRLPPLRDRPGDLPALIDYFLKRFNHDLGKEVRQVPSEALSALTHYPWPGNIRELQSVLKQSLLLASGPVLLPDFLPLNVRHARADRPAPDPQAEVFDWEQFVAGRLEAGSQDLYAEAVALMEREVIARVLRHVGGNQLQAARILGIARNSLRTKIRTLGITIERTVTEPEEDE